MTAFLSGEAKSPYPAMYGEDLNKRTQARNAYAYGRAMGGEDFCAGILVTSEGIEYKILNSSRVFTSGYNDPLPKAKGKAIFRPTKEKVAQDIIFLEFLENMPSIFPEGWDILETAKNDYLDEKGGFKIISVFFMIALKSGDLVDGYFRGIKLKYLCFGTTKLSSLFDNLKSLVGVQGVMQESYAKSVSFDAIAPDQDPSAIKEQGKYFMDVVKLPWMKPGVGFVNQGSSLDRNKTIDENKLTSEGVIYCEAYQPGNGLTAYPKGDPGLLGGINWFDAVLDIVTSLAGSKSGTSTGR